MEIKSFHLIDIIHLEDYLLVIFWVYLKKSLVPKGQSQNTFSRELSDLDREGVL